MNRGVLRFVKAFFLGLGGLFALGNALMVIRGNAARGSQVHSQLGLFLLMCLLMVGVWLSAAGLREFLYGVQALFSNRKAARQSKS